LEPEKNFSGQLNNGCTNYYTINNSFSNFAYSSGLFKFCFYTVEDFLTGLTGLTGFLRIFFVVGLFFFHSAIVNVLYSFLDINILYRDY